MANLCGCARHGQRRAQRVARAELQVGGHRDFVRRLLARCQQRLERVVTDSRIVQLVAAHVHQLELPWAIEGGQRRRQHVKSCLAEVYRTETSSSCTMFKHLATHLLEEIRRIDVQVPGARLENAFQARGALAVPDLPQGHILQVKRHRHSGRGKLRHAVS